MTQSRQAEDPQIRRAIEQGAKNRRTLELLRNWCAHVGIRKLGSGGFLEEMTGEPIGPRSVVCEHAASDEWAGHDLASLAVRFHDVNCVGCAHRKPVGSPNLMQLVAERDASVRLKALEEERITRAGDAARAARKAERVALRRTLDPVQATLVDQLEALDGGGRDISEEALAATAGLAPEAFAPQLVEHLFGLVEAGEHWATATALETLRALEVDGGRLVRCAVLALRRGHAELIAAKVIEGGVALLRSDDVDGILPPLIELACPLRGWVFDRELEPLAGPLLALHRAQQRAVEAGLEGFLWNQDLRVVGRGARGIVVIAEDDGASAARLARATISKLARGLDIPERQSGERDIIDDLRTAAGDAFEHDPEGTNALMDAFRQGATDIGQGRVFSVYREVLGRTTDGDGVPGPAQGLAIQRLLEAVTGPMTVEVQKEVEHAFQRGSDRIRELASRHLDALLGAAALLDERLSHPDEAAGRATNPIERIEADSRRSGLMYIRDNLVDWVSKAASGDVERVRAYLALLAGLPEDRDAFRALMIGHLGDLVTTPETFATILPSLYSAIVGSSSLARGRAGWVVGQLSKRQLEDAPPLLLEAFVTLLFDPFVGPVSSAVSALHHMDLPPRLDRRVAARLAAIVQATAESRSQSAFLVSCIRLFVARHLTPEQRAGPVGEWLVGILALHSPKHYARELRFFPKEFGTLPGFGRLVVKSMMDEERMSYGADDVYSALGMLDAAALHASRKDILDIALASGDDEEGFRLRGVLVEVFGKAGDWDSASQIAERAVAVVPDTRRDSVRRLVFMALLEAVRLEHAIAEGRAAEIPSLSAQWRCIERQLAAARQ